MTYCTDDKILGVGAQSQKTRLGLKWLDQRKYGRQVNGVRVQTLTLLLYSRH